MNWYKKLKADNYQMYYQEAMQDLTPIITEQFPTNLAKLKARSASMANATNYDLQTALLNVERLMRSSLNNLKMSRKVTDAKPKFQESVTTLQNLCKQIQGLCQASTAPDDPISQIKQNINNIKIWYDTLEQQQRTLAAGTKPQITRQGSNS